MLVEVRLFLATSSETLPYKQISDMGGDDRANQCVLLLEALLEWESRDALTGACPGDMGSACFCVCRWNFCG